MFPRGLPAVDLQTSVRIPIYFPLWLIPVTRYPPAHRRSLGLFVDVPFDRVLGRGGDLISTFPAMRAEGSHQKGKHFHCASANNGAEIRTSYRTEHKRKRKVSKVKRRERRESDRGVNVAKEPRRRSEPGPHHRGVSPAPCEPQHRAAGQLSATTLGQTRSHHCGCARGTCSGFCL